MLEVDASKASSLEIRGWGSQGRPDDYHLQSDRPHLVHIVDLRRDLDSLLSGMTRNGRYNLRHSMKCPMTVKLEPDEQALKALHRFTSQPQETRKTRRHTLPRSILRDVIVPGTALYFRPSSWAE
jgi:hypothetical protein